MASPVAAMSGVAFALQAAGSTSGNGNVVAPPPSFRNHTIIIKGSSGVLSGAVQMETTDDLNDANTWAPVGGGPVTVVASTDVVITLTGLFMFLRARYSTAVTGGTAGIDYLGAKSY